MLFFNTKHSIEILPSFKINFKREDDLKQLMVTNTIAFYKKLLFIYKH